MATLFSRIFGRKKPDENPAPTKLVQLASPESAVEGRKEARPSHSTGSNPTAISGDMQMQEVMKWYPAAQRALFQKYHVGGCHSCGFDPMDTLEEICLHHNLQVDEILEDIKRSQEMENEMQVSPAVVAEHMKRGEIKLLDVRASYEHEIARIEGAILLDEPVVREIIETWPKDTPIVTHCHHGMRSLDAAAYLKGHGFSNVQSMTGGIDAWSLQIDPTVPRY